MRSEVKAVFLNCQHLKEYSAKINTYYEDLVIAPAYYVNYCRTEKRSTIGYNGPAIQDYSLLRNEQEHI